MPPSEIDPIVGRKEMAATLGVHSNNSHRDKLPDLPATMQEIYGTETVAVSTPIWWRADIEAYADERKRRADNLTP